MTWCRTRAQHGPKPVQLEIRDLLIIGVLLLCRCEGCKGKMVYPEKKVIEVQVEKGMRNKQKITLKGMADEAPGTVPGDVVFIIVQKEVWSQTSC